MLVYHGKLFTELSMLWKMPYPARGLTSHLGGCINWAMRMLANNESDLLLSLHEGVFEEPLWRNFLELLKLQTNASGANLVFRTPNSRLATVLASGNDLPGRLMSRPDRNNPRDFRPHQRMRPDRVYALDELINTAEPKQKSLLEEALFQHGMSHLRCMRLTTSPGIDAWLTLFGDHELDPSTASLMSRLAPHLKLALRSFSELEKERVRSTISSQAIGRLNFSWLTLDARCRILDTTDDTNSIFRRTNLIRRGPRNHLILSAPAVEKDVRDLVRQFSQQTTNRPRAFNLSHDPWMDILVAPIQGQGLSIHSSAVAIVYLSGDRRSQSDRCEQLVDLFGLLPSEARLAWAIAQGYSIKEAAEELDLTIETARHYSKKVYLKTGARGQADLVRIVFTSVLAIV